MANPSTSQCPNCRGVMIEKPIDYEAIRNGTIIRIRDVMAWVCESCRHRMVTSEVADRLNRIIDIALEPTDPPRKPTAKTRSKRKRHP